MSPTPSSDNSSPGGEAREELAVIIEKSRATVDRLNRIIAGQQELLEIEKDLPNGHSDSEACRESTNMVINRLNEHRRELDDLNAELEKYINELGRRESSRDITGLKQAEAALKLTQASIDLAANEIVWITPEGKIVYANEATCRALQRSRDELLRMYVWDIHPKYTREMWQERWQEIKKRGSFTFETIHYANDGREFPVEVSMNYVKSDGREFNFAYMQDITGRKRMEEALQESEERLRRASRAGRIGLFEWNVDQETAYLSPEVHELYGLRPGAPVTYETWLSMVHPDDREMAERTIMEAREKARNISSTSTQLEYRAVHPDGAVLWLLATATCNIEDGDLVARGAVRDITKRKRAEEALRASEEKYRELVENANSIILRFDMQGNLTFFNEYAEKLFGFSKDEALGRDVVGTIVPPSESTGRNMDDIIEDMKRYPECYLSNVNENVCKNGDRVWIAWTNKAIRDEQGNVVEILSVGNDITERKNAEEALQENQEELEAQAEELRVNNEELERQIEERLRVEEALRESEEKFRILADSTYDWVVWSDPTGDYVYVSPSCERITGHRADDFYDDPGLLNRIVHPEDMVTFEQHMDTHLLNASICGNFDFRIMSTSGETRWINHVCRPVFRDNGEWLGRRASNRDITERKRAEKALLVSEERLRRASSAGRIGLFERNEDRERAYFSPEAYELYGLEPGSQGPRKTWLSTVHPDDREMVERGLAENRENARPKPGYTAQLEFRVVHNDWAVHWLEVQSTYTLEDGELIVRGVVRDVTGRKRVEKELEDHRKRLEDLVQERTCKLDEEKRQADLYVDLMCHDISNMNQVGLGFLEMALDLLDLDEANKEMLLKPRSAFENSSRLIDNVRKLRKVKACECQDREMDVGEVLKNVRDDYSKQYGNATISNHAGTGYVVKANELLYDLFSNLIGNAIKHSKGDPIIDISVQPAMENGHEYYRVSIDDRGPGIPDGLKAGIFERKLTGDVKTKGSGIGLLMVKTLVDSYGGRVWVEDRVKGDHSKGSRFAVLLPSVNE